MYLDSYKNTRVTYFCIGDVTLKSKHLTHLNDKLASYLSKINRKGYKTALFKGFVKLHCITK